MYTHINHLIILCRLTLSATILLSLFQVSKANCPNPADIKPCTCNNEGLQCLQLNDSSLDRIFIEAPNNRKAIRRVWIFQTNLTSIKRSAFGDYIVRDLYLDLNQIQTVQAGAFGRATETLQTISLSRNSLNSFPFQELILMSRLKQLGLGHNKFTNVSSGAFSASHSLESLDLSNNLISSLEAKAFSRLYRVSMIDLSKNLLSRVSRNSLLVESTKRNLMISLRANQISSLAADAFGGHHPLTLDLSKNRLSYLDEYVFAPLLMNNTLINVAENPFSCYGCQLYRWLLEFNKEYLNNLDNFSCLNDDSLEDLTLESIGCA